MIFNIKENKTNVAKIFLCDPQKKLDFFSNQSDPKLFTKNIENKLIEFAKIKKDSKPLCVIMGRFEESENVKKIYPGYFWESLALLMIMPSYFDNVSIINTGPRAEIFYLKVYIGEKYYYGLLVSDNPITISEAKIFFTSVKALNLDHKIKPIPINNFPVKLISFDGGKAKTIYTSKNANENYTCLFMAVK